MSATRQLPSTYLVASVLCVHTAGFATLMSSTFPLFVASSVADVVFNFDKLLTGNVLFRFATSAFKNTFTITAGRAGSGVAFQFAKMDLIAATGQRFPTYLVASGHWVEAGCPFNGGSILVFHVR